MSNWKKYERKSIPAEMRPYKLGEDLTDVSVGADDREKGSPQEGDMVARDPDNHADQWLVNKRYFVAKFEQEPIGDA